LLQGSAEQALQIDPPFDHYIFIERSPWRNEQLRQLQARHFERWGTVSVLQQDANAALQRICSRWNRTRDRAVVFLDPFGMSVEWATLRAIAETESMDVWYLFPVMAFNRLLPREREPLPEWEGALNRCVGADDWRTTFYQRRQVPSLLQMLDGDEPEEMEVTRVGDWDAIRDFVVQRLGTLFPAVAQNPLFLSTPSGTPLFLLCFAASNPRGAKIALRIAEHILGTH
jgi:three-Cys-motif partner protein